MIHVLLSAFCLKGQTTDGGMQDKDALLNQYELTCGRCLELRTTVNSGGQVSRKEASGLIDSFVSMNSRIKASSESLTPAQHTRFEAVNRWFSTGERPLVLDHEDLARIRERRSRAEAMYLIGPMSYYPAAAPEDIGEPVLTEDRTRVRTYVLATVSLPHPSYGAMIGLRYRHWGGYARFHSNFLSAEHEYTCLADGTLEEGGSLWPGGNTLRSKLAATAGVLYGPMEWLSIYAGAGYGSDILYWDDIDGNWVNVSDCSFKGPALEAGILTSWKFLTVGAGVSAISFRTLSADISFGISF